MEIKSTGLQLLPVAPNMKRVLSVPLWFCIAALAVILWLGSMRIPFPEATPRTGEQANAPDAPLLLESPEEIPKTEDPREPAMLAAGGKDGSGDLLEHIASGRFRDQLQELSLAHDGTTSVCVANWRTEAAETGIWSRNLRERKPRRTS